MESLRYNYQDDDEDDDDDNDNDDNDNINNNSTQQETPATTTTVVDIPSAVATTPPDTQTPMKEEPLVPEELSDFDKHNNNNNNEVDGEEEYEDDALPPPHKKQKTLSEVVGPTPKTSATTKKFNNKKKKAKNNNSVWTKPTSRKGKKKTNNNNNNSITPIANAEDIVKITPLPRFLDKNDDSPEMTICLSKAYKAEKVELSEDRLSAGSCKGYRMVRATRGVVEGAWYFEIKIEKMGITGHTRLGWSTDKGDLQAPVGYDGSSFGYRDIDGCKIHKALREKYGEEGYGEGDVIGFYISLPQGSLYTPKPPQLVWYKGQRYVCAPDPKEDPPRVIPGSEISFFKNGICQGVAFKDLYGGRYYPAASMYTLPNQSNCTVRFNFGPDFESFPEDFGGRPFPEPMIEVPYHGFDSKIENGKPWVSTSLSPSLKFVKGQDAKIVEDGNDRLSLDSCWK